MKRETILQDLPVGVGVAWARALCESIEGDGSPIEGGWPGTMVEARARVSGELGRELSRHALAPPSIEEFAAATNIAYARARQVWLEVARRTKAGSRRLDAGG